MSQTKTEQLLDRARQQTLVANHCEQKVKAWNRFTRSLVDLIAIYEGSDFQSELKALYDKIVVEKQERTDKLIEIGTNARIEAARAMEIYEDEVLV